MFFLVMACASEEYNTQSKGEYVHNIKMPNLFEPNIVFVVITKKDRELEALNDEDVIALAPSNR